MSLYGAGDGCHADTIGCCHHLECPLGWEREVGEVRREGRRVAVRGKAKFGKFEGERATVK